MILSPGIKLSRITMINITCHETPYRDYTLTSLAPKPKPLSRLQTRHQPVPQITPTPHARISRQSYYLHASDGAGPTSPQHNKPYTRAVALAKPPWLAPKLHAAPQAAFQITLIPLQYLPLWCPLRKSATS